MPSPNEVTRRPLPKGGEMPDEVREWFQSEGANMINTTLVDAVAAKLILAFPGFSFDEAKVYVRELIGVDEKSAVA